MIDYIKLAKGIDEGYKTVLDRCKEILEIRAEVWNYEGEDCEYPSLTDWGKEEFELNGDVVEVNSEFCYPYSDDYTKIRASIPINYLNKSTEELAVMYQHCLQYERSVRERLEFDTLSYNADRMGYKLVRKDQ